jgi:hypothetical protein
MAIIAGVLALVIALGHAATSLASVPSAPTAAQPTQNVELGQGWLCVHTPDTITRGDTETIDVSLELADSPSDTTEGRVCEPVNIYETMGVGIAGIKFDNFEIDPPDIRIRDRITPGQINYFTWSAIAIGEDDSRHNLVIYAYVDDDDRSTGFRSIARVPARITILAAPKSFSENLLEFVDSAKEILIVLGGLLTAGIAFRGQVKQLFARNPEADK